MPYSLKTSRRVVNESRLGVPKCPLFTGAYMLGHLEAAPSLRDYFLLRTAMNSPASSVSSILLAELPWVDNSLLDETLTLDTLSDSYSLSSDSPAINQGVLESTPKPINSFRKQSIYASRPLAKRVTPAATVGIGALAQPNAQEGLSVKDWAVSRVWYSGFQMYADLFRFTF